MRTFVLIEAVALGIAATELLGVIYLAAKVVKAVLAQ